MVAYSAEHEKYLDIFPVQKIAQFQGSAKHHGGHISNNLQHFICLLISLEAIVQEVDFVQGRASIRSLPLPAPFVCKSNTT